MKNYIGILLVIIGALIDIVSYFAGLVDYNFVTVGGLVFIIAGLVVHILVNKKS